MKQWLFWTSNVYTKQTYLGTFIYYLFVCCMNLLMTNCFYLSLDTVSYLNIYRQCKQRVSIDKHCILILLTDDHDNNTTRCVECYERSHGSFVLTLETVINRVQIIRITTCKQSELPNTYSKHQQTHCKNWSRWE